MRNPGKNQDRSLKDAQALVLLRRIRKDPEHAALILEGCTCSADSTALDRCEEEWIRCNGRLRWMRKNRPMWFGPKQSDEARSAT